MAEKYLSPDIPISKEEEKGLLYGSLISAGIAAMSGQSIPEAIQNAVVGFGAGYSGGLSSLLKIKEDQMRQLREQEELKLKQLQVGLAQKQLTLEEQRVGLTEKGLKLEEQKYFDEKQLKQLEYDHLGKAAEFFKAKQYDKAAAEALKANNVQLFIALMNAAQSTSVEAMLSDRRT